MSATLATVAWPVSVFAMAWLLMFGAAPVALLSLDWQIDYIRESSRNTTRD